MQTPQWKEDNMTNWKGQEILNEKNMPSLNFFEAFSSSHCPAAVRKRARMSQPQQLQRTSTQSWKISASLSRFCTQSSNIHTLKILVVISLNESPTTATDPAADMAGNTALEKASWFWIQTTVHKSLERLTWPSLVLQKYCKRNHNEKKSLNILINNRLGLMWCFADACIASFICPRDNWGDNHWDFYSPAKGNEG